jgi:hypothetical protein
MASELKSDWSPSSDLFFKVILRDFNPDMVAAWQDPKAFGDSKFTDLVEVGVPRGKCLKTYDLLKFLQISSGDIFDGAPAADAIVSFV